MMRKRPWPIIILLVFLAFGCVKILPGEAGYGDKVRILVLKGANEFEIRSEGGTIEVRSEGPGRVMVNGRLRELPLKFTARNEFVYLNGKPFRGAVEVAESKDGLIVINELFLESYLVGIINNEISSKWPKDVIKTQAVIARTYALYNKAKRPNGLYHVEGSVMGQVYSGVGKEDEAAFKAVKETAGEILTFSGEPALTVYHSNAGGMTDSSKDVWERYYPYLLSIESPYDSAYPQFYWGFSLSAASLGELLKKSGLKTGEPAETIPVEATKAGRVKSIVIEDKEGKKLKISGEDLRKAVGYSTLRSTIFEVKRAGDLFVFKGKGSGHGVGLSQWGAKGMAEEGYSYREILKHYYPGTDLVRAY
ncbi:MAG: SpoIID/LytB domain-containing protein [Deltaproteobacteria bacterium]|nr:SpoIID/LytB domain-containing protein [Deltaproteobacteria bacterium]